MHELEQTSIELPIQVGFARAIVNKEGWQVGLFFNSHMQRGEVEGVIIRRETRAYSGGDGIVDLLVGFPVPGQEFMEA
ncbi:hypothetical protein, partial [Komagataeibacter xylinus]